METKKTEYKQKESMHNSFDVGCLLLEISYTNYTICLIRLTRLQTCESTEKKSNLPNLNLTIKFPDLLNSQKPCSTSHNSVFDSSLQKVSNKAL